MAAATADPVVRQQALPVGGPTSGPALPTRRIHDRRGPRPGSGRQQVPECAQPRHRALEHRDPERPQPARPQPGRRPTAGSPARRPACRSAPAAPRVPAGTTRPRRTPPPGPPPAPRPPPRGRPRAPRAHRRRGPRCRRRVPQTSSGLVGSSPGSSSAVSRATVAGARSANGTPSRSATSATSTRSAPESCTVARPRPPEGSGRRAIANSSRLSVSSERSAQRCTPYAVNSASQPASEPAMAPECASTSACPRSERPDGQRDHRDVARGRLGQSGLEPGRRRASSPARARPPASRAATGHRRDGRPSCRPAPAPTTPTTEYSSRRWVRSSAEKTDPECVTSAIDPVGSGSRSR